MGRHSPVEQLPTLMNMRLQVSTLQPDFKLMDYSEPSSIKARPRRSRTDRPISRIYATVQSISNLALVPNGPVDGRGGMSLIPQNYQNSQPMPWLSFKPFGDVVDPGHKLHSAQLPWWTWVLTQSSWAVKTAGGGTV